MSTGARWRRSTDLTRPRVGAASPRPVDDRQHQQRRPEQRQEHARHGQQRDRPAQPCPADRRWRGQPAPGAPAPPHRHAADHQQDDGDAWQQHQQLVGQPEITAHMDLRAQLDRLRPDAVAVPAILPQQSPRPAVILQRALSLGMPGGDHHGVDAGRAGRQVQAIAPGDPRRLCLRGDRVGAGDRRIVRVGVMPAAAMLGMGGVGCRHRSGLLTPRHATQRRHRRAAWRDTVEAGSLVTDAHRGERAAHQRPLHHRPGEPGQQQERDQRDAPHPRHRMQVTPEHAAPRPQPRPQHARHRPPPARPPQEQPRRDQHQRPARRQLHHRIAPWPEGQRPVHDVGEPDQRMGVDIAAQHPSRCRVDHHLSRLAACGIDPHLCRTGRRLGQVDPRRHARDRRHRRRDHPRRRERTSDRRDDLQIGHQRIVQLVLEQIDRARDAQDQQERCDDQPGIEMPAPDRAIKARIAHRRPPGGRWSGP